MPQTLRELLGIDAEELDWKDLGLCQGDDTNDHYENYEADEQVAKMVDEKCLSCPVMVQCMEWGIDHNEWGVWGGVYLVRGSVDDSKNAHKSAETWQAIQERING